MATFKIRDQHSQSTLNYFTFKKRKRYYIAICICAQYKELCIGIKSQKRSSTSLHLNNILTILLILTN